jgi:hypothetical protein
MSARSRPYKLDGLEATFTGIRFRECGRDRSQRHFVATLDRPDAELVRIAMRNVTEVTYECALIH